MKNEEVLNDVMRKTFPKTIFIRSINEWNKTQGIHFSEEWLNQEYSTELAGEWIPVSKRLPDDGEWAIFTDGSTISVERFKSDAIDHFYPQGRWFSFDNATAWMPLPEPYKAESEEQ